MGEVMHLFQSLAHGEPVSEFDEVFAVENKGLKDCIHGRDGSKRQVLLMDSETLEEFGVAPGRVKENITTRGIALATLPLGKRLRVGDPPGRPHRNCSARARRAIVVACICKSQQTRRKLRNINGQRIEKQPQAGCRNHHGIRHRSAGDERNREDARKI